MDQPLPNANETGLEGSVGSTGGESRLFDRRECLRFTGATVAALATASAGVGGAAGASVRTIEVGRGNERRIELDGGDTLENTIIDVSARGASVAIRARTRGEDIAIRNVAIRGVDTQADDTINVCAYDENSTITIEHCYFGDGGEDDAGNGAGEGEGCVFVNASHAGDLLIRNVYVANWETGIYASAPGNPPVESKPNKQVGEGGTIRIEDCYLANIEKSGYKLGSTGSYVQGSVAKDAGNPIFVVWNEIPARDVDIRNRGGEAFNVGYKFDPAGEEAVAVIENCRATADRYVVGPGSARGSVDPNPDLTPPAGVPMSAVEAASGESSGGGGSDGGSDLPNHVEITGTGDLVPYDFAVSGDLEAGPEFDTDGTDGIDGSTASGQVNLTGTDDYYFSGRITDFAAEGDVEVSVNGEAVDPNSFLPRELRVQAVGDRATYEFEVSGALEAGPTFDTDGTDGIDGSVGTGRVGGTGDDDFYFDGDVLRFTHDGPLEVYVDGEQVDPDGVLPRELTISNRAYDTPATYEFAVSEDLGAT